MTPTGRLDLHCHLIPGVDDGCRTLSQSIAGIRAWMGEGYVGSVCTPHVGTTWYPENTPDRIFGWVTDLRRELRREGIDYALWPGGELRLSKTVDRWMRQWGLPFLADSRCVLVDYWGGDWPDFCDAAIDYIQQQDATVILAHPERMGLGEDTIEPLLDRLAARGVLLQGNFNSLSGLEGEDALRLARKWLLEGRYDLLCSDTHEPDSVPSRVRGLKVAEELVGAATIARLTETRPSELLFGRKAVSAAGG